MTGFPLSCLCIADILTDAVTVESDRATVYQRLPFQYEIVTLRPDPRSGPIEMVRGRAYVLAPYLRRLAL